MTLNHFEKIAPSMGKKSKFLKRNLFCFLIRSVPTNLGQNHDFQISEMVKIRLFQSAKNVQKLQFSASNLA